MLVEMLHVIMTWMQHRFVFIKANSAGHTFGMRSILLYLKRNNN